MLQSFPLVRLAALDLDGTLLNRNNEVTLATRQAIARAVEHGVVVVPATGRPLASLPPVVAKLPPKCIQWQDERASNTAFYLHYTMFGRIDKKNH